MKRILIFGVDGFTGLHLWNHLKDVDPGDVVGTYRQPLSFFKKKWLKGCHCFRCDVLDRREIYRVLKKTDPSEIYYLPALVTVSRSFELSEAIYETNILGVANFLEACRELSLRSRILLSGSAEEYGKVRQQDLPIKESHRLLPVSPYGISKAVQEKLALFYTKCHKLNITCARTFHFTGPLQPDSFVVSDFARQIAEIEKGKKEPIIRVGNLKARRDFTDIRDVVRAYRLIMKKACPGDIFNVCSGHSRPIQDILNLLLSHARVKIPVQKDPQKMRKLDIPDLCGDNSRLIALTGWHPQFSMKEMTRDVLNGWRRQLRGQK